MSALEDVAAQMLNDLPRVLAEYVVGLPVHRFHHDEAVNRHDGDRDAVEVLLERHALLE